MIAFSHITKRFGTEEPVYRDFTEEIRDGEFVVITGESGSGKTTLLNFLLKETEPDAGDIAVDGQLLSKLKHEEVPFYRRRLGTVFQDFRLIPDRTVYDNLTAAIFATGGNRRDAEKKIAHVLSMLSIDHLHKRYPRELSGGEQQKVCLARAVINHPRILLADEPTGNLDPFSTKDLAALLLLINRQGTTVLLATHDMEVAKLCGGRRIELTKVSRKDV